MKFKQELTYGGRRGNSIPHSTKITFIIKKNRENDEIKKKKIEKIRILI